MLYLYLAVLGVGAVVVWAILKSRPKPITFADEEASYESDDNPGVGWLPQRAIK